jgi:hypothetical protein
VKALGRDVLTEFYGCDRGAGHVSTKEMKMGQPDFSGKEVTHKPAGY